MSKNYYIAKEGFPFIIFFILLSGILFYFSFPILTGIALFFALFCMYFFRNPERTISSENDIVVSPADGKVMSIEKVQENKLIKGEALKISIFLSVFNVHINRMPIGGEIMMQEKVSGLYLPAYKKDISDKNARNYIGIKTPFGMILVVQITGLIARRIVSWVKVGDKLNTGDRFGLIRFGSCTEIYLPTDSEILIEVGQKVRGGETIIARFCK